VAEFSIKYADVSVGKQGEMDLAIDTIKSGRKEQGRLSKPVSGDVKVLSAIGWLSRSARDPAWALELRRGLLLESLYDLIAGY
jgi:hypothetical protein